MTVERFSRRADLSYAWAKILQSIEDDFSNSLSSDRSSASPARPNI
jgi:hypothetical protein